MGEVEMRRALCGVALLVGSVVSLAACAAETRPAPPPPMSVMPIAGGFGPPAGPVPMVPVQPGSDGPPMPVGDGDGPPLPMGDGDGMQPVQPVMPPVVQPGGDPFEVLGTDPSRHQVQGGQVCERLATIQCAGEAGCCSNPGRDFSACFQTMHEACKSGLYLDVITGNPIAGFDATRAASAFEQMETLVRGCDAGITAFGASANGLMGIIQGTVSAGGSCKPSSLIPSALEAAPHLASCADPANYACMPAALSDWKCNAKSGTGQACVTDVNCQTGLYCPQENPTSPQLTGVNCAARKPVGQPCTAPNQCETLACQGGSCVQANVDAAYCLGS